MKERKQVKERRKAAKKTRMEAPIEGRRSRYLPEALAGMYRPVKKPVTLRLDADVLSYFQRGGRGYQTRINRALRQVMIEEKK
jgi:uncharacterized protein (DUF4415 family)